jgi:hypothetical protein
MVTPPVFVRLRTCWLLVMCLYFIENQAFGQNLYDASHSRTYAAHLMRSSQYGLAAEEYQRLHFFQPDNDTFRVQLLRAYRLGGQGIRGIDTWRDWQPDGLLSVSTSPRVNSAYLSLLLTNDRLTDALQLSALPNALDPAAARKARLYAHLLRQQWADAQTELSAWPASAPLPTQGPISLLIERGQHIRHKSPALAASLSAIVPGLGKAYTRDWKDGAIGLLFVGLNAWQSYRRFDREGIDSAWGWIHGSIGLGFYIGNIYGAHKSARLFNQRQRQYLRHDTEQLLFPTLD